MQVLVPFVELVKKHFNFLLDDYDFIVQESIGMFGETITFKSSHLTIEICKDRESIIIFLKPIGEPEVARLGLSNILDANSVSIPSIFNGPVAPAQFASALESYASLLRKHANDLLRGDLSNWLQFLQLHLEKMKKDYSSLTKGKRLPTRVYQELESYIHSKRGAS